MGVKIYTKENANEMRVGGRYIHHCKCDMYFQLVTIIKSKFNIKLRVDYELHDDGLSIGTVDNLMDTDRFIENTPYNYKNYKEIFNGSI